MPRPPRQSQQQTRTNGAAPRVWVLKDGQPVPVEVGTGATNGRMTEIIGGDLEAGMEVVTETLEGTS
jgi:HlyD family secretion protein